MFNKADIVFYGTGGVVGAKGDGLTFRIHRFAKGQQETFGSSILFVKWSNDVPNMCRIGNSNRTLVFAKKEESGYSFLTDCYADGVFIENNQYLYKQKRQSEFDFFNVNPLSAENGSEPRYAMEISEVDARKFAEEKLFQNSEFRKVNSKDLNHWKSVEAKKVRDKLGQEHWSIRIAYVPQRAKGEFYVVSF